jgi:hypothetical protein
MPRRRRLTRLPPRFNPVAFSIPLGLIDGAHQTLQPHDPSRPHRAPLGQTVSPRSVDIHGCILDICWTQSGMKLCNLLKTLASRAGFEPVLPT